MEGFAEFEEVDKIAVTGSRGEGLGSSRRKEGKKNFMIKSHKDLKVWKKSYQLALLVYKVTREFPKHELYGLVSQMQRCATAIPSNIAEGYTRQHIKEYIQFLHIAYSSVNELETQTMLARDLRYINKNQFKELNQLEQEVSKMLFSLINSLKKKS